MGLLGPLLFVAVFRGDFADEFLRDAESGRVVIVATGQLLSDEHENNSQFMVYDGGFRGNVVVVIVVVVADVEWCVRSASGRFADVADGIPSMLIDEFAIVFDAKPLVGGRVFEVTRNVMQQGGYQRIRRNCGTAVPPMRRFPFEGLPTVGGYKVENAPMFSHSIRIAQDAVPEVHVRG